MSGTLLKMVLFGDAGSVNVQRWSESLSQAGAEIHLVSFTAGPPSQYRVYHIPIPSFPGKLHYFAAVPYARYLIKTICPDIVIAYYVTGYGTLGALAGIHPLVLVTAGSDVLLAPRNPLLRWWVRFNLTRSDLITAWAPHLAEAVRELGVDQDQVLTLPRGIPFENFSMSRCLKPSEGQLISIISTRSLKAIYNIDILLKAARLLLEHGMDFSLTIAGDGPERLYLERLAIDLELGQFVKFTGFIPNDRLPIELARHNLYLSLIQSDGVSASLLEAMACGLCPVVPDNVANRFWITSAENGLLLEDLSPKTIVRHILEVSHNMSLRERAWYNNPQIVSHRGNSHVNSKIFVERFQQLVNNRHK